MKRPTRLRLLGSLAFFSALLMLGDPLPPAHAEPIGLIERYALADDRQAILDELIPGSEDYYYYHCLHYQVRGQLDLAEAMLGKWENDTKAGRSALLVSMRDRQRLLTYGTSPDRTIEYLRQRLNIKLDHAARPLRGTRQYPDTLPADALAADVMIDQALRHNQALTQPGLIRLGQRFAEDDAAGVPVDLAWLLERVDGAWMPHLDDLVIRQLQGRRPQDRRFGDLTAHHQLTLPQLHRVSESVPAVATSDALVHEILLRLRPDDDTDPGQQPEARRAYLIRLDQYVSNLPDAWNSLKAAVLYRRLEADLAAGEPDRSAFVRYLKLPRNSPVMLPRLRAGSRHLANLSEDFSDVALVPPIGNETSLVRQYLEIFLRDADSPDAFAGLLRDDYLNDVFAETKLLYGVGDPQRWYRLLHPAEQQQLKDRVELTLAPTNPAYTDPEAPAEVTVDIKNVKELVVRVYEINTHAYYRTHNQTINTDIDLDGLVATEQLRIQYDQPSVRRHRETISLPGIEGRGVWVVDLLGGGRRTRALIQRGELQYALKQTIDGVQIVLFDEAREVIPKGRVRIGSQQFLADDDGVVTIPMGDKPLTRNAVMMDDRLAITATIQQPAEQYSLAASILLVDQQLQPGRTARLTIRPQLLLNGERVSISLLEDAALTIVSTDSQGVQSSKRIEPLQLDDVNEAGAAFRVPDRLKRLEVRLSGYVTRLSTGRRQDLKTSDSWSLNGFQQTEHTVDAFLTRDGTDWIIEARGRNGEAVGAVPLNLRLVPIVSGHEVQRTLQTDDDGRVRLGSLATVRTIHYGVAGGPVHRRTVHTDQALWPRRLHGVVGHPQQLPIVAPEDAQPLIGEPRFVLFELRGDRPYQDRSQHLRQTAGQLRFTLDKPGNYRLLDRRQDRQVSIAVTAGTLVQGIATGQVRQLEVPRRDPVAIAEVRRQDGDVVVQLGGDAGLAHVHVVASRYLPARPAWQQLKLPATGLPEARYLQRMQNLYLSDLELGEEYAYVLRRQYAQKYPGVMLPQPSLLLNPWATEETENTTQQAADGQAPAPSDRAGMRGGEPAAEAGQRHDDRQTASASYDFLRRGAGLTTNLRPDDQGRVRIPGELVAAFPILQIVAIDPANVVQRTVYGRYQPPETRDLRLTQALDPQRALAFERTVRVASAESPLERNDLGAARLQVYANVADLLTLYNTFSKENRLGEFQVLGSWHELETADKYDAYGRLACHEVHVFLYFHDRPFFDDVVRPYLQSKKEKQFIDHWLLDRDLTPWTVPWQYARLNAAERALLAVAVPEVRASVLRDLKQRVELQQDDDDRIRQAIEWGLAGQQLQDASPQSRRNAMYFGRPGEASDREALGRVLEEAEERGESLPEMDMDGLDMMMDDKADFAAPPVDRYLRPRRRGRAAQMFQHLDATKQWAESHWHSVRVAQADADLIPVNAFWLDVARHGAPNQDNADANDTNDAKRPGIHRVSEHLLLPTENRHAALMALALCGLPLASGDVDLPEADEDQYAPQHPVAVVTKRLRELQAQTGDTRLLVAQRFERLDQQATEMDAAATARVAPEEYLTQTGYLGQIVLTNPTPAPMTVEVFWQIPAGSLPLAGSLATDSETIRLEPFAVERREYRFYFPTAGRFTHYPVCVSIAEQTVARGQERTFNVVETPTTTDSQSWQAVARSGAPKQIEAFLSEANLHRLDLSAVAHRLRDRAVYDVVMQALDKVRLWPAELLAYALHHRDEDRMRQYLSMQRQLVQSAGPVLSSELLRIEPVQRALYEHLEYAPLVRARIHPLREQPEILNNRFLEQYRDFMRVLAYQAGPSTEQQLALCYYLLIQNRIDAALERFQQVDSASTALQLQRDYLAGYLALHRGDLQTAAEMAARHAEHPVPRWRERFGQLAQRLEQHRDLRAGSALVASNPAAADGTPSDGSDPADGSDPGRPDTAGSPAVDESAADLALIDRQRRQAQAAYRQPSIQLQLDGRQIRIAHRNAREATVNLYGVDLELLFSKTPFVRDDLGRMATVRPALRKRISLRDQGVTVHAIDASLAEQTLLVEVISGSARDTVLYYGGNLRTYLSEGFGQLQASDRTSGQPLAGAYVKVYSRTADGQVAFYKDGYTDLRGRFDYVSLSAPALGNVQRFAILVLDAESGASVHDVPPPTQ